MITSLIDKLDNFEIIRDKIATILANEVTNQKQLAIDNGKDSILWDFKVYTERSNPWEKYLNSNENATLSENLPIVNVWFDNYSIDDKKSNTVQKQFQNGNFNVDIYAMGISKKNESGHLSGDEIAAREVQRVFRLVRNILMAGTYTYLDLRGVVSGRWITSVTSFQPEQSGNQLLQVQAMRLSFRVDFIELSPQVEGQGLEYISNEIKRNEDGSVIGNADYSYL